MGILHVISFAGIVVAALAYRCHVSDTDGSLHCGDVKGLNCSNLQYAPYCHRILGDNSNMNGVCTCDKFCFVDSECTSGCRGSTFVPKCKDAYTGSVEKFCVCALSQPVG